MDLARCPGTVKGWCKGYLHRRDPRPAVVAGREIGALVFFDELVELRVVRFLRDQKIPLPRIREASHRLARDIGPLPLARTEFFTDHRNLVVHMGDGFTDLRGEQSLADFAESFLTRLKAPQEGRFTQWVLRDSAERVMIDKHRQWGEPIVDRYGIRSEILASTAEAEGSYAQTAKWFEVSEAAVAVAVDFKRLGPDPI